MKFYNYINEKEELDENVLNDMSDKCKIFLKDLESASPVDSLLWSGRKRGDSWFIGNVRKDRTPKDTPIRWHEEFDRLFYKKFGIKARSQTLFCNPIEAFTDSFGNPYMIFPIGKYEILWNSLVTDLTSDVVDILISDLFNPEGAEELRDVVDDYIKGRLKNALSSESEIMLYCDKYYAIHYSHKRSIYLWLRKNHNIKARY